MNLPFERLGGHQERNEIIKYGGRKQGNNPTLTEGELSFASITFKFVYNAINEQIYYLAG